MTGIRTADGGLKRTSGAGLQGDSALRLVSANANGYCLRLEWVDRSVYHLRGPGGHSEPGAC